MELIHNKPDKAGSPVLILAHGAGAAMDSPFMDDIASLLCEQGIHVVRFEFPYMAGRRTGGKKRPPDRQPVLLDTWRSVVAQVSADAGAPVWIGGKSMGGRMATVLMSGAESDEDKNLPVAGVACLGYPFHPIGKPDKLRIEHLPDISVPTVICQGSRDPMGSREEVDGYDLPEQLNLCWLEDGNHDLKPRKASGFSHDQHIATAAETIAEYMHNR
ncbi:alpha/beta family hydrolase [Endozoicomonadaceae bacterium StTr2]